MHAAERMLTALCVLLPAIVVAAGGQGEKLRAVAGAWSISSDGGATVFTHEAKKWPGTEGFPLALFEDPASFGDGTARIRFKLIDGTDDYSAGLVFGHAGGASYYYARYNTKDGNVAIWRMDGPKRTVLKHGEYHEQLPKHAWHELVVTIDGRKIRAAVAGRPLEVEHELEQAPSGRLGVWTKPDATSAFSGLRVERRR